MPPDDNFVPFTLAMIGVCIPTYLIVVIVNNPEKVRSIINTIELFFANLISSAIPKINADKIKMKIEEQRSKQQYSQHVGHSQRRPMIRKTATHASFEARLTAEMSLEPLRHASQSLVNGTRRMSQTLLGHHLPGSGRGAGRKWPSAVQSTTQGQQVTEKLPRFSEEDALHDFQNTSSLSPPPPPPPSSPLPTARRRARTSTITFEEPVFNAASRTQKRSSTYVDTLQSEGVISRDMERSSATLSPMSPLSPGTTPPGGFPPQPANGTTDLKNSQPQQGTSAGRREGPGVIRSMYAEQPQQVLPEDGSLEPRSLIRRLTDWYSPLERSARPPLPGRSPSSPSPREQV